MKYIINKTTLLRWHKSHDIFKIYSTFKNTKLKNTKLKNIKLQSFVNLLFLTSMYKLYYFFCFNNFKFLHTLIKLNNDLFFWLNNIDSIIYNCHHVYYEYCDDIF